MTRFRLRFPVRQVARWAAAFSDREDAGIERLAARARRRGCLTKADFLRLAGWKTSRSRRRVERNTESFVRAVTRTAMATPEERLRIEVLTLLDGVDWPTASVILHFCHREPYPVLDYRALWSLGVEKPPAYNFAFWWDYTLACRRLAARASCSMRELDRALWQFSKEKQGEQPRIRVRADQAVRPSSGRAAPGPSVAGPDTSTRGSRRGI